MIRIILVDDQDIMVQGLKLLLEKEKDINVVSTATNGQDAYRVCLEHNPDIVLMDMNMPIMNGVEATKLIKRDLPKIKVIVLTTFNDDEYIFNSLKYGASGYLLKDATPEEIINGVRMVYKGGAMIQPQIASKVIEQFSQLAHQNYNSTTNNKFNDLTKREISICKFISEGKNNKEIAKELFLSEGTVKNHLTNILNKLELRDRTQLAIFYLKNS